MLTALADLVEEYGVARRPRSRRTRSSCVLDVDADRRRGAASPRSTRSGSRPGRRTGGATRWPAPASSSASSRSSRPSSAPRDLVAELEQRFPDLDTPITVNVNGCPNACARTQVADIGLKGQLVLDADGNQVEGFQVHLGGAHRPATPHFGRKLRAHKVTSAGLDDYVTDVVTALPRPSATTASRSPTWVARADEDAAARRDGPLEAVVP